MAGKRRVSCESWVGIGENPAPNYSLGYSVLDTGLSIKHLVSNWSVLRFGGGGKVAVGGRKFQDQWKLV